MKPSGMRAGFDPYPAANGRKIISMDDRRARHAGRSPIGGP